MSTSTVFSWLRSRRFDVDAAVIGLLAALAMFPLRFLASQIYIETIPIVLGVACILYLLSVRSNRTRTDNPALPSTVGRLLPVASFVGLSAMVLVATFAGQRSLHFYLIGGLVGTTILAQVLFTRASDFRPTLLLAQILSLTLVVRFGALYTTPGFIGIDIWTHMSYLAEPIYNQGSLSPISTDKHYAAPFYHLLVVTTAHLLDVSLREALILSIGVAVPFSILFIYATTKLLVPVRWAVFATMLYSIGDYFIEWGIHLIPTSHGLVFFLGMLYSLLRIMQIEYNMRDFALLVLFTVAIILTHQVSTFIMLVVIGAGLLAQFLLRLDIFNHNPLDPDVFRTMNPVNLIGLLVFDVGLITFMWSLTPYNGDSFLETVLIYLGETLKSSAGFLNLASDQSTEEAASAAAAAGPTQMQILANYVDTLGFLLLLCLAIVGCVYVLRRQCAKHSVFTLLIATVIMLFFVLGLPLFGIRNFIPQRWFAFLYAPMAILSAIGVRFLSGHLNRKVFIVALLLFSAVFPATMVMSSNGTLDSPVFTDERERLSYTEPELAAVSTIEGMTGSPDSMNLRPGQVLRTDHPYQTVFWRTGSYPTETAVVTKDGPQPHNIKVYREYQSTGASFFRDANGNGKIRDISRQEMCRPTDSVIYSNGDVTMCTGTGI